MCNETFGEAYRPATADNRFLGFPPRVEAERALGPEHRVSPPVVPVTSFYTGDMEQESIEPDCDGY